MSKRKSSSKSSQEVFICNICRSPFDSRDAFSIHCDDVHNIILQPDDEKINNRISSNVNSHYDPQVESAEVNQGESSTSISDDDTSTTSKVSKRNKKDLNLPSESIERTVLKNNKRAEDGTEKTDEKLLSNKIVTSSTPSTESRRKESRRERRRMTEPRMEEFLCPVPGCSISFKKQGLYINHLEIHEGLKPFACPYCNYGYEDDIKLMNHVAIKHTKNRSFECERCEKTYLCNHHLTAHKKKCRKIP